MVRQAKRKGVAAYLRVLQGSRLLIVGALLGFIMLQVMVLAGFSALITAFLLIDYDWHTKLEILLGFSLVLFLGPMALLMWVLSERAWYRHSGAAKMVDDLNRDPN